MSNSSQEAWQFSLYKLNVFLARQQRTDFVSLSTNCQTIARCFILEYYPKALDVIMKLVSVFNFWKCYRVNLVFSFHDVFLSVFFSFTINKLCFESTRFFAENVFLIQSFTRHPRASAILIVRISGFIAANIYCVLIQTLQFQTMT